MNRNYPFKVVLKKGNKKYKSSLEAKSESEVREILSDTLPQFEIVNIIPVKKYYRDLW